MKDLKNFAKEHIIIFQILASLGLSLAFFTVSALLTKANGGRIRTEDIMSVLIFSAITAAFLAWPIIMVLTNLYFLIVRPRDEKSVQNEKISMILSIGIGTIFSYMLLVLTDIRWVDWNSQLYGITATHAYCYIPYVHDNRLWSYRCNRLF